jgi:diguanylate cyclase (GGDEF)-like protein/PAS domain S-box-containing protein
MEGATLDLNNNNKQNINLTQPTKIEPHFPFHNEIIHDLYSLIYEHYPDAIFLLDEKGNLLSINDNVREFIGYTLDELKEKITGVIKQDNLDKALTYFRQALAGDAQNFNLEILHKNGHVVHLNFTNIPLKVNGEIRGVFGFAKNLTKIIQKEEELVRITNSLNLAQEVAKIGSWDYDAAEDYVYCSSALLSILGIKKEDGMVTTYHNLLEMIHEKDREMFDKQFQKAKALGTEIDLEYRIQKFDRTMITVHVRALPKKDQTGKVIRIIGVLYDISKIVHTEVRLKESEEKFETIVNNLDIGIWSFDAINNRTSFVSPAVEKITGYSTDNFLSGKTLWQDIIHPDDLEKYRNVQKKLIQGKIIQHQYRIKNASGQVRWVEDKTLPTLNNGGKLVRLSGIIQDISERKRSEEKINFIAYHDYLTELPNRRMFDKKLKDAISIAQARCSKFALFYLDIDRFKLINDTLGHEIGDLLLKDISKRLTALVEKNNLFRLGGDEFAIIQSNILETKPAHLGQKILKELEKPFYIKGYDINISTSIGVSLFPDDGVTVKKLQMNSDVALFRAKELGKNNMQFFTNALNSKSLKLFNLANDLRKAIDRDQFILNYQPRVDAISGEVIGAEALIRWNHPKLKLISPAEFIPLAEETGVINDITYWVINSVCKQMKEWKLLGCKQVPVSINLSARTLMKADLVQKIQKYLERYTIPPQLIEIEITEDTLIRNESIGFSVVNQLKDLGISISLDDFGTGYSSIGYLKKLHVDFIKIDRSYIRDIHENKQDLTIVQSIILLANGFQSKVVAEGVENQIQWNLLKQENCHCIQGYLFSKPLPLEEFTKLLLSNNGDSVYLIPHNAN